MTKFDFRVQRCFPESLARAWGQLVTQFQAENPRARISAIQHQTTPSVSRCTRKSCCRSSLRTRN